MKTEQLALVRGIADTKAALRSWRERPSSVLVPWALGSLAIAVLLLVATWVVARLNQTDAPPVLDGQRLEAELVALAARHGGPDALGEVAGRVEARWIARRLEPLKEKLAAAEITPEEMRELQSLQALARKAGGR